MLKDLALRSLFFHRSYQPDFTGCRGRYDPEDEPVSVSVCVMITRSCEPESESSRWTQSSAIPDS